MCKQLSETVLENATTLDLFPNYALLDSMSMEAAIEHYDNISFQCQLDMMKEIEDKGIEALYEMLVVHDMILQSTILITHTTIC